ncbi:MAG: hypothetical protein IRZ14_01175 [Chloroflexi bacterium]|nr:hypothetical protein [Chloroflexota bacterium]
MNTLLWRLALVAALCLPCTVLAGQRWSFADHGGPLLHASLATSAPSPAHAVWPHPLSASGAALHPAALTAYRCHLSPRVLPWRDEPIGCSLETGSRAGAPLLVADLVPGPRALAGPSDPAPATRRALLQVFLN